MQKWMLCGICANPLPNPLPKLCQSFAEHILQTSADCLRQIYRFGTLSGKGFGKQMAKGYRNYLDLCGIYSAKGVGKGLANTMQRFGKYNGKGLANTQRKGLANTMAKGWQTLNAKVWQIQWQSHVGNWNIHICIIIF